MPNSAPHAPTERGPLSTEQLVHAAYILRRDRVALDAQIAEVEAALIERGPGKHSGEDPDQVVTIVAAIPGHPGKIIYALDDRDAEKAKALEAKAREIAADQFAALFDRKVSYTPCAGFDAVAPKLLTPAKSRDLLALCAREGKPYAGQRAQVRYA